MLDICGLLTEKGEVEMSKFITSFWNDESGISSVEYALLLAFVAAGVIAGATALSGAVTVSMNDAASCIGDGTTGC